MTKKCSPRPPVLHALRMVRVQVVTGDAALGAPPQLDALPDDPLHDLVLHVAGGRRLAGDLVRRLHLDVRSLGARAVVVDEDLPRVRADDGHRQEGQEQTGRCHLVVKLSGLSICWCLLCGG